MLFHQPKLISGVCSGAVGWGTALQAGRSRVRFPMASLEFFLWYNPSGNTTDLVSTLTLTEMSTSVFSGGKGGRCIGLTTLPPSCGDCLEILAPQTLEPSGPLRVCIGIAFYYTDQYAGLQKWDRNRKKPTHAKNLSSTNLVRLRLD